MTKYAWLLLSLHSLYMLYMFGIHSMMENDAKTDQHKHIASEFLALIKLNIFVYMAWLPLYLWVIKYGQ